MPVVLTKTSELDKELKELVALLTKCVGPKGQLLIIGSATGRNILTSLSARLCPELQNNVAHPVLTFLLHSTQAQNKRFKDGGLWTCICAASLLNAMIRFEASDLICNLCNHGLSMLSHAAVRVGISLDSVRPLLLVAQSVLKTKPGAFGSACSDVSSITLAVVKAFIETSGMIHNVVVQTETGFGEPRVLSGLLWRTTGAEVGLLRKANWKDVSVLIVTEMLTDTKDPSEKVETNVEIEGDAQKKLASAIRLVKIVVEAGIRVLACQRVVHSKVELLARRSGLLVLPRLGRQTVCRLERLSGAKPIRGDVTDVNLEVLARSQGRLTDVQHEVIGDHDFLVLGGEFLTLLLHAPTSEVSEELNTVANQALTALGCAVSDQTALPGAGCIEVWLCAQMWGKVTSEGVSYSTTKSTVLSVLRALQLSLLSAAGLDTRTNTLSVDSQRHHSWNTSLHSNGNPTEQQCRCGLVAVCSLDSSTQWTIVDEHGSGPPVNQWSPTSLDACSQFQNQSDIVLDAFSVKRNAFRLAVDTASTLASVGATLLPS